MTEGKPSDRRGSQRLTAATLKVEVRFASWHVFKMAHAMNISQGGLMFQVPYEPPIGQPIAVTVRLPNGHACELQTEVCHVQAMQGSKNPRMGEEAAEPARKAPPSWQVGVKFSKLDAYSTAFLAEAVAELERAMHKK